MATEVAEQKQIVTHSMLSAFRQCRKKCEFAYEYGIRPGEDSFSRWYGTHFHECVRLLTTKGISFAVEYARAQIWRSDPFPPRTLSAQIRAYYENWSDHPWIKKTLWSEQTIVQPLTNPETGRPSLTFDAGGKLDAIVELQDCRIAIRELKTMSEDPSDESSYWLRLLMDPQISHYFLLARAAGYEPETIAYDVVRKPCIKPLKATPVEDRKYTKAGTLYANQRDTDETPDEWETRLYDDMTSRPTFYLNRREIPRLEQDLDAYAQELWDTAKDFRQAQLTNRWYRTVGRHCDQCAYFGLCTGLKVFEPGSVPDGFERVTDIHPELS